MKKLLFITFFLAMGFFLLVPHLSFAAQGCKCDFVVTGEGCNIDKTFTFSFGQNVTLQSLLNNVNFSECPSASIASTFIDTSQSVNVTEEACDSSQYSGSDSGYTYLVSCGLTDEAPNFKDPFSPEGSQSLSAESVGCILFKICPSSEVQSDEVQSDTQSGGAPTVVKLQNPLGEGRTDIRVIMGDIISIALGVVGSFTLVVFIYGGFMWLTSAGSAEKVKKGKDAMFWAVVGLFIIFSGYAILNLVFSGLGAVSSSSTQTPISKGGVCAQSDSPLCSNIDNEKDCTDFGAGCAWFGSKCVQKDSPLCSNIDNEKDCTDFGAGCEWFK